jgi:hypothetical protein
LPTSILRANTTETADSATGHRFAMGELPANLKVTSQVVLKPEHLQTAAGIATNAWRLRARLLDTDRQEPRDETSRRLLRHVDAIVEGLKQFWLEIEDPTGQPYDSGLALKVVSFEPTAALTEETIIETVRPAIRWQGQLVQVGEVIVGIPPEKNDTP